MACKNRFPFIFSIYPVLALGCILLTLCAAIPTARANLLLNPTRVVLDNRNKSAVVTVINQDTHPIRYRVSLALYRYKPNGGLEEITDCTPEEDRIKALIRFSPRQAVLPPRGHQKIRLQFRKPRELAEKEYRVHLKVSPVPDSESNETKDSQGPGVKIKLMVGVAIPIVIRNGTLWADATPVSCDLITSEHTGQPALNVKIMRKGPRSVIMDIQAFHLHGGDPSTATFLGQSRSAVIYPDFDTGTFEIPIEKEWGARLTSGTVRIDIKDSEIRSGKGENSNLMGTAEFSTAPFH